MLKQTFLFVLGAALLVAVSSESVFAQQAVKLTKPNKHSHAIPIDSAKKFISNLNKDAMQMKTKGGMFYREDVDKLLAQKGVTGIRYYYAKTDDGTPTIVLVGIDSTGRDMTNATILEKSNPCPPYCDDQTTIDK